MFDFTVRTTPTESRATSPLEISNLADIINLRLPQYRDRVAIRYDKGDFYKATTYGDYLAYVHACIAYFAGEAAEGKIIATLCRNRLEWDMVALASFYTANVLFPIDAKTNSLEFSHLISIARPDYILVSPANLQRFREIKKQFGLDTRVLIADVETVYEDLSVERVMPVENELLMSTIISDHMGVPLAVPAVPLRNPETILAYYATSGTTHLPKIVSISNGNILAELKVGLDIINFRSNEDGLNIGPYTHIATLVEFLVSRAKGVSITYFTREPDEDGVLEAEIVKLRRQNVRLRALMAVPKFWIFLLKDLLEELKNKTHFRSIYDHLTRIERNDTLVDIGTLDKAKLMAIRIFLRNKLGGFFSYGISSSMKLDESLVKIFGKLGITIIDVYGATECTGIISLNRLSDLKPGTCGKIIRELDWELRDKRTIPGLAQAAGILHVRGPTVASSYVTDSNGAREPLAGPDGYFNTGDLCWIDDDGWLHLLGREKELIAWDDGSLIDPQHLSNLLVRNIYVKDALVTRVNPEDEQLSVFLFPDYKKLEKDPGWVSDLETGIEKDAALRKRMLVAIEHAQAVSAMKAVMNTDRIYILPGPLERTPTHKIKFIFELERLHLARQI
jgi:long-subunit acyl-CoA synthetase (AMP-forming)